MNAPVDLNAIEGMFKRNYEQIEVKFEPEYAVPGLPLNPAGAPCFNLDILEELRRTTKQSSRAGGVCCTREISAKSDTTS